MRVVRFPVKVWGINQIGQPDVKFMTSNGKEFNVEGMAIYYQGILDKPD